MYKNMKCKVLAFFHSEVTWATTSHLLQLRPPQPPQRPSSLGWTPSLETFWTWTWGDPPCSSNRCIPHSPPHRPLYRGVAAWISWERDWILWLVYVHCTSSKKSQSPITGAQQINTEILVCVGAKVAHVTRPTYNHGSNIHNIIYLLFDNLDNCHIDLLSSKIMICITCIWVFVSAWWTCSKWGFFRGTG